MMFWDFSVNRENVGCSTGDLEGSRGRCLCDQEFTISVVLLSQDTDIVWGFFACFFFSSM